MRHLLFLFAGLLCLALPGGVAATPMPGCTYPNISYTVQLTPDNECGGYLRHGITNAVIQKHGYCRFLDNNGPHDYFVPALSPIELVSFFTFLPGDVTLDRCIRPYTRTDIVSTDCGIPPSDEHYGDVLLDNPNGCLMTGNMTSITHEAVLTRWTSRAAFLNGLSETPPVNSLTTLLRADTDNNGLTDRSTYSFPMQRADCRTAHNGERVCNHPQFSQYYVYNYSIPSTPVSEMGHVLSLSLSTSNNAPPFGAPGPLNCPPSYSNGQYYEVDGGTTWRPPTASECPDGPGTRQCEQRVYNQYLCNDGLGDITGVTRTEDTGTCTGDCASGPKCNTLRTYISYGSCTTSESGPGTWYGTMIVYQLAYSNAAVCSSYPAPCYKVCTSDNYGTSDDYGQVTCDHFYITGGYGYQYYTDAGSGGSDGGGDGGGSGGSDGGSDGGGGE